MGAGKKIVAGAFIIGSGLAMEVVGGTILSATGTASGPFVNYRTLVDLSSTALLGVGGIVAGYGVLEGLYTLWRRRRDAGGEDARSSRSQTPPSSRRDRPRNPSRW